MARAGIAWRRDTPLAFGFLVYRDGDSWCARSLLTAHFAYGSDADDALEKLTSVLDAAMLAARDLGMSQEQWMEQQAPTHSKYMEMFTKIIVDSIESSEASMSTLPSGTRIKATIARAA